MLQLESAPQSIPHGERLWCKGTPQAPQEGTSIQIDHLVVLFCHYLSLVMLLHLTNL